MLICHTDPAPVHQLSVKAVRADQIEQHPVRVFCNLPDLRMDDRRRDMTHDRYAIIVAGKYRAEDGIIRKHGFQRAFKPFRFNRFFGKTQTKRIAGSCLRGRIQDRVIEISLIGRQVLLSFNCFSFKRVQIRSLFFGQTSRDLPGRFPRIDIFVVHMQLFQLRCDKRR